MIVLMIYFPSYLNTVNIAGTMLMCKESHGRLFTV